MITLALHAAAVASIGLASPWASRMPDGRAARALGVAAAAVSLGLGVAASALASRGGEAAGVDGISSTFVLFVGALALVTLLGQPTDEGTRARTARVLLTTASLETLFLVREPLLVFLLFAASAIPTYVALRANRGPNLVARGFATHQVMSALLVGAGLFLAGDGHAARSAAALLLTVGLFVRQGALPFHSWMPPLFEQAPLGSAAIFVHSQAGAYLLARLLLSTPDVVPTAFLDLVGVATAIYGATLACAQSDARRALGYLAVGQSALVLTGLASAGVTGIVGGLLMVIGVGLAQAGAAVSLECVRSRRGDLVLGSKGHVEVGRGVSASFLALGLAGVGLPGTLGFVAEDLVFHSALEHRPLVGAAMVLATSLSGLAVLRIYFGLAGGERRPLEVRDLLRRERVALVGLFVVLLGLGLASPAVMGRMEEAISRELAHS